MDHFRKHSRLVLPVGTAFILALTLAGMNLGCKRNAAPENDQGLTRAVQTRLAADTSLASETIQASVQQGVATLYGSVSSDAARSLAADDAAQISGIRTVVNNLTVQPATAQFSAPPPPPLRVDKTDKLKRREQPSTRVATATQTPPPSPAPENTQPAAPVERVYPPAGSAHTPPTFPAAAFRAITLPTDTSLPIRINTTLDSATTQEGDSFTGSIASDVVEDGLVVLAQGTPVSGRVDTVQEAAHFKGNSLLSITLTGIERKGDRLTLTTDEFSKAGNGRGKNTAEKVGGGAAIGAILGGILGGGKGAAIGAGVGGAGGAGVQAATKGQQVQIPAETLVRFHLTSPLAVRVSTADRPRSDAHSDNHGEGGLQTHDEPH